MIIEARDDNITLRGEIRSNIWPAIQAAAALLLENYPTGIIIDASAVSKVTSKGAETFSDAFSYISGHHARIVVAGLSPDLLEIGKTVPGVRAMVPIASTVDEARRSLELEEVTPLRGRARSAAVVPILGNWQRALFHAERLAEGENCELHMVDLIQVPRTLPLGSPLPERESAGQERLERARTLIQEHRMKSYSHAEHVRSESAGLVDFVAKLSADFAVVSLDRGERTDPYMEEAEAMSLIEAAEFEVSVIKGTAAGHYGISNKVIVPVVGAWEHALEHACKLVSGSDATIAVVHLTTIPRTEPIDAPRPDADAAFADCTKEAMRISKRFNVTVNTVPERVRDPVIGFMQMVPAGEYGLAVVGVRHETTGDYHIAHSIATTLLHEQPCETVFLKVGL